jgi:four helix bundle protein
MTIRHFSEIKSWQKARELTKEIYLVTASGPIASDWGLRDQLRRAAISITCNIAEGFARGTPREFARFLDIARGSAAEVQSLLFLASDIGRSPMTRRTA